MTRHCKVCHINCHGWSHWIRHLNTNRHKQKYAVSENKVFRKCSKCGTVKQDFYFVKTKDKGYYKMCDVCRKNFRTKWNHKHHDIMKQDREDLLQQCPIAF